MDEQTSTASEHATEAEQVSVSVRWELHTWEGERRGRGVQLSFPVNCCPRLEPLVRPDIYRAILGYGSAIDGTRGGE